MGTARPYEPVTFVSWLEAEIRQLDHEIRATGDPPYIHGDHAAEMIYHQHHRNLRQLRTLWDVRRAYDRYTA
jgi:hypothetical protein